MTDTPPGPSTPEPPTPPDAPGPHVPPDAHPRPGAPDQYGTGQYQEYGQYQQHGQYGPPPGWQAPPQPPKPGVIPLRPLSFSDILDGSFATMRAHPKLVFGGSAVVVAITQLVNLLLLWPVYDDLTLMTALDPYADSRESLEQLESYFWSTAVTSGIALLISTLTTVLLSGFITVVVGQAVVGKPIGFTEAWAQLKPRLLPLLGVSLLYTLLVVVGFALCVLPGVWVWVLFALVTPAVVLEHASVGQSLRRSRELVRGVWWRTFGILLLAFVLAAIVSSIIQAPFGLLGTDFSAALRGEVVAPTTTALLLSALGGTIAGAVVYPFSASVQVLLYLDRRIRREGMDIMLARAAGVPPRQP
ncbi:hypothetical protein [Saccharothrix syringae]|uniref:DUF7847 domain-containing protein n=1 Tax=Saccharothrix syringae TaxID=103733 RepID=A0A5Q0H4V5_SACSY|nr:hypothetical protein [Saccharothrix syringae]QFZ21033.1 hypothetical protein EKG83_29890 [Saccharothrix syringae]